MRGVLRAVAGLWRGGVAARPRAGEGGRFSRREESGSSATVAAPRVTALKRRVTAGEVRSTAGALLWAVKAVSVQLCPKRVGREKSHKLCGVPP